MVDEFEFLTKRTLKVRMIQELLKRDSREEKMMNKKQFFEIPHELKDREWYGFNWLEHVTAIPAPLVLVTGYKQNGAANATMQSWFCFSSENEFYCIFGSVNKGSHMYEIAIGRKQMVINFPNMDCIGKCMDTVKNNGYETDELSASGLHYRDGSKVSAPVVDECFLNLECETMWERELYEGSYHVVLCVRIVNIWMDEAHYNSEKMGRYGEMGYLYNVNAPLNPETWETDNEEFALLQTKKG